MNIIKKLLDFVSKNLFPLIALSIILGLLNLKYNNGFAFSASICILAAFIMILPSLVPLHFTEIFNKNNNNIDEKKDNNENKITDTKTIFLTIFLNFFLYPAIAFLISKIFFPENKQLFLGLILLSILPGGGMITT
jgi:ACR3 family arsenite efflux pump ArsB